MLAILAAQMLDQFPSKRDLATVLADGTIVVVGNAYNASLERTEAVMWIGTTLPPCPGDLDGDRDVEIVDCDSGVLSYGVSRFGTIENQGGVAAAVGPDDSPALHAADTLAVGGAVGNPEAVARLTKDEDLAGEARRG